MLRRPPERFRIGTMHLAKGLEFRAVAVMACDDEIIPLQERIETVADDADLEDVYSTERQLPYVACTRSRDYLLVSGVAPASEFLDDLQKIRFKVKWMVERFLDDLQVPTLDVCNGKKSGKTRPRREPGCGIFRFRLL
jgi:superfamily I DNA/RNA helicase